MTITLKAKTDEAQDTLDQFGDEWEVLNADARFSPGWVQVQSVQEDPRQTRYVHRTRDLLFAIA